MNKLEKVRELKKEVLLLMEAPWWCGRSPFEVIADILGILEEDYCTSDAEEPCCEEFETCEKACVPRADYLKEIGVIE